MTLMYFFQTPDRNTLIDVIRRWLASFAPAAILWRTGKDRCFVAEHDIVERIAEHPFIQESKQSPQKLLNWYRTHRLIAEGLAKVILK